MTGSAKTCQDVRMFENHFLAFYNSVIQGDYNDLCFTSVACSVVKLRAPQLPCSAEERLEYRVRNETSSVTIEIPYIKVYSSPHYGITKLLFTYLYLRCINAVNDCC